MRAADGKTFENIAATTAAFNLEGGYYEVTAIATWGCGSVKLSQLGPDGSTYVDTAVNLTANGFAYIYLPPCSVKFTIATATAVYVGIYRVPGE